jgi:acetate kinase
MDVLSLNPRSGTLLYKLLAMPAGAEPRDGEALKEGKIDHVHGDATIHAAEQAVTTCLPLGIEAIGFRVVHGGTQFDKPARITPDVIEAIRSLSSLRRYTTRSTCPSSRPFRGVCPTWRSLIRTETAIIPRF